MSELEPCPFCGGEIKTAVVTFDEKFYEPPYEAWYLEHADTVAASEKHCPIPTTDMFYDTEAEAIAAWNTRAEMGYEDVQILLDELGVSERMCKNNAPAYLDFLCSECGFVHYHSEANDTGEGNEWNYCPNCGARVTPKNSETTPKVVSE